MVFNDNGFCVKPMEVLYPTEKQKLNAEILYNVPAVPARKTSFGAIEAFFSVNLVSRALTVWDNRGATLGLLTSSSSSGSFSACRRGESTSTDLGERFSFTYPTWPVIGVIRNNEFFHAEGDRGNRLELLCHTTKAELDPDECYAYISLETLRDYMVGGNFFTSFSPSNSNIWSFAHARPLREITVPRDRESFQTGGTLAVRATIQDVDSASLILNGRTIETKTGLSNRSHTV